MNLDNKVISVEEVFTREISLNNGTPGFFLRGFCFNNLEDLNKKDLDFSVNYILKDIDLKNKLFIGEENNKGKYFFMKDYHKEYIPYDLRKPFIRDFLFGAKIKYVEYLFPGENIYEDTITGFVKNRKNEYRALTSNMGKLTSKDLKECTFIESNKSIAAAYLVKDCVL